MEWSDFAPLLAGFLGVYGVTGGIAKQFRSPQSEGDSKSNEIESLGQIVGGVIALLYATIYLGQAGGNALLWTLLAAFIVSGVIAVWFGRRRGIKRWKRQLQEESEEGLANRVADRGTADKDRSIETGDVNKDADTRGVTEVVAEKPGHGHDQDR